MKFSDVAVGDSTIVKIPVKNRSKDSHSVGFTYLCMSSVRLAMIDNQGIYINFFFRLDLLTSDLHSI